MSEKHCIYCGTTEKLTVSDIIPDALTNARITNDCVCQGLHNSQMTEKFESQVSKRLSFLINELDIKSSKSKHYADYSATIEVEGTEYDAKKMQADDDFIRNRRVLWNREHTQVFGDIDTIKKIAISYGKDESEVQEVNINDIEFVKTVKLDIEVFFSLEMYRQVAKIAYEWYCAQNNVSDKYDDFVEIIEYIVEGNGKDIVSIVSDNDINEKFRKYCNSGSHCLVGYISNEGKINVFVDLFGLIVYNVKVCDHVPKFCMNNCLLQKLNLDTSRQSLCLHDYNDLPTDMINAALGIDERFPQATFNGINICVPVMNKDVSGNLFIMELLDNLSKGFSVENSYSKEIFDMLLKNIEELLQASVLHKRSLKRFIIDRINFSKEIVLNLNGNDKKSIFNYFVLYCLGKEESSSVGMEAIEKIVQEHFNSREIVINDKAYKKMKDILLLDTKYSSFIFLGAQKILDWK